MNQAPDRGKPDPRRRSRVALANGALAAISLALTVLIATLFARSDTGFSHFTRVAYCSLCGVQQVYREMCVLDHRIASGTSSLETGISRALGHERPNCGHALYSARERMIHLSRKTTPMIVRRDTGTAHGRELLANRRYEAAIQAIHATNAEAAQLIWARTLTHAFKARQSPLDEIRTVLERDRVEEIQGFLQTNRYFRPARLNVERVFGF